MELNKKHILLWKIEDAEDGKEYKIWWKQLG